MLELLDAPIPGADPAAVAAAVDDVRGYCGWHIAPNRTETFTLDGSGSSILVLPSMKVTAVVSVVEAGVTLDPLTYTWSDRGVIERVGLWTSRRRGVVVTITHGYAACPPAVMAVVARVAKDGLTPDRLKSWTRGPFSETSDPDFPAGAIDTYSERILARYQLPPRP